MSTSSSPSGLLPSQLSLSMAMLSNFKPIFIFTNSSNHLSIQNTSIPKKVSRWRPLKKQILIIPSLSNNYKSKKYSSILVLYKFENYRLWICTLGSPKIIIFIIFFIRLWILPLGSPVVTNIVFGVTKKVMNIDTLH